jgi:hypothetical protein
MKSGNPGKHAFVTKRNFFLQKHYLKNHRDHTRGAGDAIWSKVKFPNAVLISLKIWQIIAGLQDK